MRKSQTSKKQIQAVQGPTNQGLPVGAPREIKKTQPTVTKTETGIQIRTLKTLDSLLADICTPTGVQSDEVAIRIVDQVGNSLIRPKPNSTDDLLVQAISTIAEFAPQNVTEGLLATQMIATHDAALMFVTNATRDQQTFEGRDANILRATRLMRLYLEQIEAMQKLKGKAGQQLVTVEHVHVYQGGQAIVGDVNAGEHRTGGGGK